ncbi:hypothetical protein [Okeania sp.]|uniref:hypothetical protein n=1 Tax=Okeania sp. TaxID=3100323 RepID=UPI002B4AB40B|nr:hypothetical protein [Okeania sp.]
MQNQKHFHFLKLQKKIGGKKEIWLRPHIFCDRIEINWGCSSIRMTFYSTQESRKAITFPCGKKSQGTKAQLEVLKVFPYPQILSPITFECKTINIFISSSSRKKIGGKKEIWLRPHIFCDRIEINWGCSPMRMTFYSTK